jgi:hypothetical protein
VIAMLRARRPGATWDAVGRAPGVSGPRAWAILRRWLFPDEWADMQRACAERRLGQMLIAHKALPREQGGGMNKGGRPRKTGSTEEPVSDREVSLSALGIDKKLSSRAQRLAASSDLALTVPSRA